MVKKGVKIISVFAVVVLAGGIAALVWWLVSGRYPPDEYTTVELEVNGLGDVESRAAFVRIRDAGDMFWWFYPCVNSSRANSRPIVLWLDGVIGIPPSLLANFGMFGPYDVNMNRRENSWVDNYNLLFVDAPLGTGFSAATSDDAIPDTLEGNTEHLVYVLESFYSLHESYRDAPLYIFGQGHGSQLALSLAVRLNEIDYDYNSLTGVVLGNGIVSPALAMTKLGFYLEELGYIDASGRAAIETLSNETNYSVENGDMDVAFDRFLSLDQFVNANAGAVAVNLNHIVEKLTREDTALISDYFGQWQYLKGLSHSKDLHDFMDSTVAPALGIDRDVGYDRQKEAAIQAFSRSFMVPSIDKVEYLLNNTEYKVIIYNGNLDAVSNTPGQLEWVNSLQWSGQEEFTNSARQVFVVNQQIEGYFRITERLRFYWINVAGQSVPLDSPVAMRRFLELITGS